MRAFASIMDLHNELIRQIKEKLKEFHSCIGEKDSWVANLSNESFANNTTSKNSLGGWEKYEHILRIPYPFLTVLAIADVILYNTTIFIHGLAALAKLVSAPRLFQPSESMNQLWLTSLPANEEQSTVNQDGFPPNASLLHCLDYLFSNISLPKSLKPILAYQYLFSSSIHHTFYFIRIKMEVKSYW